MCLSINTQTSKSLLKSIFHFNLPRATNFHFPRAQHRLSESYWIDDEIIEDIDLEMQYPSGFNEATVVWLARAGHDIREMDLEEDNDAFDWLGYSEESDSMASEEAERAEDDRRLSNSAPDKARRLALSRQELFGFTPSSSLNESYVRQDALPPKTSPSQIETSIPGMLPDSILDGWDESIAFRKMRQVSHSPRMAHCRLSKRPRFLLVVDPPQGEEVEGRGTLKRRAYEGAKMDDQLLMPPPRQSTRNARKKEKLRLRANIRMRVERSKGQLV